MGPVDLPRNQVVVVPLEVMLAVCDYLAGRPFVEVASLALQLQQLTTLKEYQAGRREAKKKERE